jgi:hypothetical protein
MRPFLGTPTGGNYAENGINELLSANDCLSYNPPVEYLSALHPNAVFFSYVIGLPVRLKYLSGGKDS